LEVRRMGDGIKVLAGALVGAFLVLLLVGPFSGGGMMGGMGPMIGGAGSMVGGGVLGMLFGAVFWVAVAALIFALVVWIVGQIQRR
jgi:hypothetical protein